MKGCARLRPAEGGVQPGQRLRLRVRAVEHADVLDTRRQRGAPRRAVLEAAVGVSSCTSGPATRPTTRRASRASSAGSSAPTMTSRLRGLSAGVSARDAGREQRHADGGLQLGVRLRMAHHDVRGHRMAEHGAAPVAARQAAHEGGHLLHRRQQRALACLRLGQAAAQGRGVAAMARVVEGHGDVAVARQGQRKGLHQLLRSGKAMRDQHHRRGGGGRRRPEHRHRRGAHAQAADQHAAACRFELPDGRGDGQQRQRGGQPGPRAAHFGGTARRFGGLRHRCILA